MTDSSRHLTDTDNRNTSKSRMHRGRVKVWLPCSLRDVKTGGNAIVTLQRTWLRRAEHLVHHALEGLWRRGYYLLTIFREREERAA
eukprot:2614252-Amphidinium_carterae.2